MLAKLNAYAKTAVAVVGFLLIAATTSSALLGDASPAWLPSVIAALTAVGVFLKKNVPA